MDDIKVFPKGPKYYENFDRIFCKEESHKGVVFPTPGQLDTAISILEDVWNHGHSEDEDCQAVAMWLRSFLDDTK